ncbi:unnamed protein product, partial [marine sediment metagenome]
MQNEKKETRVVHYNKKGNKEIKIGLLDSHYFLINKTNVTSFAIEHYEKVKRKNNWNYIYRKRGKGYKKNKSKVIDSYYLINLLLKHKNKLLNKITVSDGLDTTFFHDREDKIEHLNFSDKQCQKVVFEKKEMKKLPKIWFDFETTTNGEKHEQYLVCWVNEHSKIGSAMQGGTSEYNSKPAYKFLQSISGESVLIAHNLGYDFRFLYPYLYNIQLINKGNKIIMGTAHFYHDALKKSIKLHFKDSLFLIPMALKGFAPAFGLGQSKEVM